jgi:indolepyruvate ferredoxin oxidoreductase beta subunit
VTVGDAEYPSFQKIQETIRDLARKSWFVDASEIALSLGSPLFTNIIMVGALVGTNLIPLARKPFEEVIKESFSGANLSDNLKAFERGLEKTQGQ